MKLHRVAGESSSQTLTVYDAPNAGFPGEPFGTAVVPSFGFATDATFASTTTVSAPNLASTLNGWTTAADPDNAFKFVGAETSGYTYKSIEATLDVTFDWPPDAPIGVGPADGAAISTLTPMLAVNPAFTDAGPESTYRFQIWDNSTASGAPKWDMGGYGASRSVTVPNSANLRDGATYSWRATSKDGGATSLGHLSTFRIDRRLGQDATQAAESIGPLSVNVGNGNVTFSTSTPSIVTAAGSAAVSFAYNSSAVQTPSTLTPVLPGSRRRLPPATVPLIDSDVWIARSVMAALLVSLSRGAASQIACHPTRAQQQRFFSVLSMGSL